MCAEGYCRSGYEGFEVASMGSRYCGFRGAEGRCAGRLPQQLPAYRRTAGMAASTSSSILNRASFSAPSTAHCFGRRTGTVCAVLRWQIARTCGTGGQGSGCTWWSPLDGSPTGLLST